MNNLKITRNFIGVYTITLVDHNITFKVENLNPYKIEGLKGWEIATEDERLEDIGSMFTDTLRDAKLYLKYFPLEDFGI
jgi:hypothetical protein